MKDSILNMSFSQWIASILCILCSCIVIAQDVQPAVRLIPVDSAWAGNSVNVTVFRKNSLVTYKDTQYISFYDQQQYVVLGKRKLGTTQWQIKRRPYKGNVADAHNIISIMIDGAGYLHLAWDQHNNPLRYCRSVAPGSLKLTNIISMTGKLEKRVTYPEFYRMPNGNVLFLYRDGESGQGNVVINQYNIQTRQWKQLHSNLIDGENQRNAYWQACIDKKGTIHVSWVWRETADAESNHDLCYARSTDGGITWTNAASKKYSLPINAATAEYICRIPQKMELINQTSMYADEAGNPFIAGYWRDAGDSIPQYHIAYYMHQQWQMQNMGFRKTAFRIGGTGTKRIPIPRPQIVSWKRQDHIGAALIFRDEERGNKVSMAVSDDIGTKKWRIHDITGMQVGLWEPSYDTELWKQKKKLHLFVQSAEQPDNEGSKTVPQRMVNVLECVPWLLALPGVRN